jgi:hypothetical protein
MKMLVLNKVFCSFLTAVTIMACEAKLSLAGGPSPSVATHAQTSITRSSNYSSGGSMNAANSRTFMGNYGQSAFVSTNNANQGLVERHDFSVPNGGINSVYVPTSAANGFQNSSAFSNDLPMKTAGKITPINPMFDSPKIVANQSGKVNLIKPISGSLTLSGTASSGVVGSAAPIALIKTPPKTSPIVSALNNNLSAGTHTVAISPTRTHPTGSQVLIEQPRKLVPIDLNTIRVISLGELSTQRNQVEGRKNPPKWEGSDWWTDDGGGGIASDNEAISLALGFWRNGDYIYTGQDNGDVNATNPDKPDGECTTYRSGRTNCSGEWIIFHDDSNNGNGGKKKPKP